MKAKDGGAPLNATSKSGVHNHAFARDFMHFVKIKFVAYGKWLRPSQHLLFVMNHSVSHLTSRNILYYLVY